MAFQLSLVLAEMVAIGLNDVDSVSLAGFASGFSVVDKSWQQIASMGSDGYVTESMILHVNAASHDAIAANLTVLADKVRQVQEQYGAGNWRFVFLRSQTAYETNARQAHVRSIVLGKMDSTIGDTFDQDERILSLPITIERGPWETLLAASITTTAINQLGGIYDAASAVVGDLPARVHKLSLNAADTVEAWVGLRGSRFGIPTVFTGVFGWAAVAFSTAGNTGTDTTTVADGTAYGGNRLNCNFGSVVTMTRRAHTNFIRLGVSTGEYAGSFLVLVRAKCSDVATTSYVRLMTGIADTLAAYTLSSHEPVKVSSTNWKLYPLGILNTQLQITGGDLGKTGIGIEAERTAGSGALHFDVLGLVPYSEGLIYARMPGTKVIFLSLLSPVGERLVEDTVRSSFGYSQFVPLAPGASRLVYFGQSDTGVGLSDTDIVDLAYYPRWAMLRGAE